MNKENNLILVKESGCKLNMEYDYIVVATEDETSLALKLFTGIPVIKTGIGGVNVWKALKQLPRGAKILNFGYAAGYNIPVGTEVSVHISKMWHPNLDKIINTEVIKSEDFKIENEWKVLNPYSQAVCYTASDFLDLSKEYLDGLKTIEPSCLFDMELGYICAMGFENVQAIKIVSDSTSLEEYLETIKVDEQD